MRAAIATLVLLRLWYWVVGVLTLRLFPPASPAGDWRNLLLRGNDPLTELAAIWQRWDALWYQQIALHGYQSGNATIAFFPLYPLLSRLVSPLLAGQIVWAELVVSSVALIAALALLARLMATELMSVGREGPWLAALLVVLSPAGFFLLAPYTESVFLALTLASFLLLRRDRWWESGLMAAAAGLTRPFGILLIFPLGFAALERARKSGGPRMRDFIVPVLPLAAYLGLQAWYRFGVGERRSFFEVDRAWGVTLAPPWQVLAGAAHRILSAGDLIELFNMAALVGFTALAVLAFFRLPRVYSFFTAPYLILLYLHTARVTPLESVGRYTLVLFPCFMALALLLRGRPWLRAGWLTASLVAQTALFVAWTHWAFIG